MSSKKGLFVHDLTSVLAHVFLNLWLTGILPGQRDHVYEIAGRG